MLRIMRLATWNDEDFMGRIAADVPARYMDPLGSESHNVGETKVA